MEIRQTKQNGVSENAIEDNSTGDIIIRTSAEIELAGEIQLSNFEKTNKSRRIVSLGCNCFLQVQTLS